MGIMILRATRAGVSLLPLLLLWCAPCFAGLGAHNILPISRYPGGPCAECHIVHAASRGWEPAPVVPEGGWYTQKISVLCWSCHSSGNVVGAHDVTKTALNDRNHGYVVAYAPPSAAVPGVHDEDSVNRSALPHTPGPYIQCTSCHEVHNDQYRPFMRQPEIRTLCDTCHPGRNTMALRAANVGVGSDNVSVHPVNVAMASTTGASAIKTVANMDAALKVAYAAAPDYVLGGKLSAGATGNVSCETCHAVHGTAALVGVNDLLSLDNRSADATAPSSALCEGCHYGGAAGRQVGAAGTTDHPVDNSIGRAFYPAGVAVPTDWSQAGRRLDRGASVFSTLSPAVASPRCSSCHDAHGGLGTKSLLRSPVPAAANGQWCWSCHAVSQVAPRLHHSNNSTLASSQIGCGHCHGNSATNQTQWSAHNGFGNFAVGPDTNAAAPAVSTGTLYSTSANSTTYEFLCELCHNPTNPTVANTGAPAPLTAANTLTGLPSRHGVSTGTQTHLSSKFTTTGAPAEAVYIQATGGGRTFNSHLRAGTGGTNNWGTVAAIVGSYTGQNIYSKYGNYGTGTPQNPQTLVNGAYMVCESCHNLLTNAGTPTDNTDATAGYDVNLLLFPYADDGQGSGFTVSAGHTSGTTVGDGFCRGCHFSAVIVAANLAAPAASDNTYVHYPAAHTVVSANFNYGTLTPYGRSTATLLTAFDNASCPNTSTADMAGAPGLFTYPAANVLNCDSCHRPHNADANGVSTLAFTAANQATVDAYILEDGTVATNNRAKTEACAQCHDPNIQCGY